MMWHIKPDVRSYWPHCDWTETIREKKCLFCWKSESSSFFDFNSIQNQISLLSEIIIKKKRIFALYEESCVGFVQQTTFKTFFSKWWNRAQNMKPAVTHFTLTCNQQLWSNKGACRSLERRPWRLLSWFLSHGCSQIEPHASKQK